MLGQDTVRVPGYRRIRRVIGELDALEVRAELRTQPRETFRSAGPVALEPQSQQPRTLLVHLLVGGGEFGGRGVQPPSQRRGEGERQ